MAAAELLSQVAGVWRFDTERVGATLGPSGAFARSLEGYEHRPQQLAMAELVCSALEGKRFAIIEAGTGTGKSLAYLVPAIVWAVATGEKVVVSTNTINLQEQLVRKDLPFLASYLGLDFRATLVKGRSNYLCRRRLDAWARADESEASGRQALGLQLRSWVQSCREGSRSELPAGFPAELWPEVCSQSESCQRVACGYSSACFFLRARRTMEDAHILVANHHILFSDVALRRSASFAASEACILPPYRHVVLDEAHNLEAAATEHLGVTVTLPEIGRLLGGIYRRRSDRDVQGVAAGAVRLASSVGLSASAIEVAQMASRVQNTLVPAVHAVHELTLALAAGLHGLASGADKGDRDRGTLRITSEVVNAATWRETIHPVWVRLNSRVEELAAALAQLEGDLTDIQASHQAMDESLLVETRAARLRCDALQTNLEFIAKADDPGFVYWAETQAGARGLDMALKAAPLDVAPFVKHDLLDGLDSAVFTSATLSTGRDFRFIKGSLGLAMVPPARILEASIDAPFCYPDQALLCMVNDLPKPDSLAFVPGVAKALTRLLSATHGRCLVLFTSYGMMSAVHSQVVGHLAALGVELLKQGDAPRSSLLDRLRRGGGVALLATDSFWEGVDVPGDALSCVVVVKLPFRVPTEPVQEARYEALQARGLNPFSAYALPQAVIRFKQGFGRLIRTRSDRGAVVVLDTRLWDKPYGRTFLASLPECTSLTGPCDAVASSVVEWLSQRGTSAG